MGGEVQAKGLFLDGCENIYSKKIIKIVENYVK